MNYQLLFDYMSKQHGVDLIETDMIEIVRIVNEIQKPDEPQPKTIREWFEELPEPYRSEALKNLIHHPLKPNHDASSQSQALATGIDWEASPQKFIYWEYFYRKLLSENK